MGPRAGRIFAITSLIASGFTLVAAAPAVAATPACGSVITTNTVFDSDITCAGHSPAFTLDSATLDLDGHTITGDGTNLCVEVIGTGSILENGTITGCDDGAELVDASAGHIVRNVKSINHSDDGFEIESDNSIIRDNTVSGNGDDGFDMPDGQNNHFFRNKVSNVGDNGFEIGNSPLNRLWSNTSAAADGVGFLLETGATGNVIVRNVAKGSGLEGFGIQDGSNEIFLNTASGNDAQGFYVDSDDNVLGGNKATGNDIGIHVDGVSTGNKLLGNTALDNASNDLQDNVDACVSNTWEGNTAKLVGDNCIRNKPAAPVAVTPDCGETLQNGSFFLKRSITDCSGPYALQLVNATLDMRGNTIGGNGALGTCVLMDATPSLLENGVLSGCDDGVLVPSTSGGHVIRKVKTKNIADDAFDIEGDDNILHRNSASGAEGHSFRYGGNDNFLFKNKAKNDVGAAFDNHGAGNMTWSSRSTKSLRGFVIDEAASAARFFGNKATGAAGAPGQGQGFDIRSDSNILLVNTSIENKGDGFDVRSAPGDGANFNLLGGNKSIENRGRGIVLSGAVGNAALGNTAKRNKVVDLRDPSSVCAGNTWEGNVFGTADQSCIS